MVGAAASIPERILVSDDLDIVVDGAFERAPVIGGARDVEEMDDVDDGEGEEEEVGLGGMVGHEGVRIALHLADEVAFDGVDAGGRAAMDYRRFAFFVYPYLQPLLHLNVTPEYQL